jgi:tripartite-type tricarboxylate transporter receptor subunit TctC
MTVPIKINTRRQFVSNAATYGAAMASSLHTTHVLAQAFPSRTIRIVVPFNAGGPVDLLARGLSARLTTSLNQPVIVENKGGAATIIGTDHVVKSAPDGYSLLLVGAGARAILPAVANLPYDPSKDLAAVTRVAASAQIFVVSPRIAAKGVTSMKALTAYARANPGHLTVGSVGAGTITSLVAELYKKEQSLQVVDVPYRGGAPAVQALAGNEIDLLTADVAAVIPLIQSKRLHGIAVTANQRSVDLPDVPTVVEAGYASLVAINSYCLFAPAKTPREVITRINQAVSSALATPELRALIEKAGMQVAGNTPEELEALLVEQTAKWMPLAKSLGIRLN